MYRLLVFTIYTYEYNSIIERFKVVYYKSYREKHYSVLRVRS